MISSAFAQEQAERLLVLKFGFGDERERIMGEYAIALQDTATSEDHARRCVDKILRDLADRPAPSELRQRMVDTKPTATVPRPSRCPKCGGTGFISRVITAPDGVFAGTRYDAVKQCECHGRYTKPREDTEEWWREEESIAARYRRENRGQG